MARRLVPKLLGAAGVSLVGYGGYRAHKALKAQPPGTKKYYLKGTTVFRKKSPSGGKLKVIGQPHRYLSPGSFERWFMRKVNSINPVRKRHLAKNKAKAAATRARNKAARGKRR